MASAIVLITRVSDKVGALRRPEQRVELLRRARSHGESRCLEASNGGACSSHCSSRDKVRGLGKADLALAEVAEPNGLYLLMKGICA
jgi:hypothetical protein